MRDANALFAYSHLGITFTLFLAGSIYLGLKVDAWLGVSPLFTLLGVLLGFAGGFYYLLREVYTKPKSGADQGGGGSSDRPRDVRDDDRDTKT